MLFSFFLALKKLDGCLCQQDIITAKCPSTAKGRIYQGPCIPADCNYIDTLVNKERKISFSAGAISVIFFLSFLRQELASCSSKAVSQWNKCFPAGSQYYVFLGIALSGQMGNG